MIKKIKIYFKILLFTLTKIFNFIFKKTSLRILPALDVNEQFNFEFSKKLEDMYLEKTPAKLGKIIFDSSFG